MTRHEWLRGIAVYLRPRNMARRRRSTTAGSGGATRGVFARIMEGLVSETAVPKAVMIDATYLQAHRRATSLRSKKGGADDQRSRLIGRTKAGMNTKLHAVTDADGRR